MVTKKTLYFCSAPHCALIFVECMTFSPADALTSARSSPCIYKLMLIHLMSSQNSGSSLSFGKSNYMFPIDFRNVHFVFHSPQRYFNEGEQCCPTAIVYIVHSYLMLSQEFIINEFSYTVWHHTHRESRQYSKQILTI